MAVGRGRTSKQFAEALKQAGTKLTDETKALMRTASKEWIDHINGQWPHSQRVKDPNYPWWTGSTHDSVSIRVTESSRTIAVEFMPREAIGKQQFLASEGAPRDYENIVGWQHGRLAYGRSSRYSTRELAAWLVIGAPYAEALNEGERPKDGNYEGFADRMFDDLYDYMQTSLKRIETISVKTT